MSETKPVTRPTHPELDPDIVDKNHALYTAGNKLNRAEPADCPAALAEWIRAIEAAGLYVPVGYYWAFYTGRVPFPARPDDGHRGWMIDGMTVSCTCPATSQIPNTLWRVLAPNISKSACAAYARLADGFSELPADEVKRILSGVNAVLPAAAAPDSVSAAAVAAASDADNEACQRVIFYLKNHAPLGTDVVANIGLPDLRVAARRAITDGPTGGGALAWPVVGLLPFCSNAEADDLTRRASALPADAAGRPEVDGLSVRDLLVLCTSERVRARIVQKRATAAAAKLVSGSVTSVQVGATLYPDSGPTKPESKPESKPEPDARPDWRFDRQIDGTVVVPEVNLLFRHGFPGAPDQSARLPRPPAAEAADWARLDPRVGGPYPEGMTLWITVDGRRYGLDLVEFCQNVIAAVEVRRPQASAGAPGPSAWIPEVLAGEPAGGAGDVSPASADLGPVPQTRYLLNSTYVPDVHHQTRIRDKIPTQQPWRIGQEVTVGNTGRGGPRRWKGVVKSICVTLVSDEQGNTNVPYLDLLVIRIPDPSWWAAEDARAAAKAADKNR